MFLFSFQTVSKFMCFTGSEKEHCIDSHVLYLDLEMTPFFVYDQFSCRTRKEIVTSVCSHGDVRMVHNLLIVEPCCVH